MADLTSDAQPLADFARTRSPQALAGLVRQHIDLVNTTARRIVGDSHLAEDVTQAAFVILAKKAHRVGPQVLPGWLVNVTRLAALDALRSQSRRTRHEAAAAQMRPESHEPDADPPAEQILPLLDDALAKLNDADRTAVVRRFFQAQTFVQIGQAMGSTEEAARKRVGRAVEKLRAIFMKQGVTASAGGVMLVLASQQSQPAPAAVLAASTAAATGATLTQGAFLVMTTTKTKVAVLILVVFVLGSLAVGLWTLLHRSIPAPATSQGDSTAAPAANSMGHNDVVGPGTRPAAPASDDRKLAETMDRVLPQLDFEMVGAEDALAFVTDVTGVPMKIDWTAIEAAGGSRRNPVNIEMRSQPFGVALTAILEQVGPKGAVAWSIKGGQLVISAAKP